jgi:DNA repair exonuclease SbcCD nuclease subunit
MARAALVSDTHFGSRSDSLQFDAYFEKFYREVFFPYIDKVGIKTVFHLGDTFERRKYVNFQTLNSCKRYFFDQLLEREIDVYQLIGNHDTFYKNTNRINSPSLLLCEYPNIVRIVSEPKEIQFGNATILLVPWLAPDNEEMCVKALSESEASVCFGHFEIQGFDMHRGMASQSGFDPQSFSKFDLVCSGHYHHKSTNGPINYLGTPYQITWADFGDPRGFHIFDSETKELEFVENPNQMFQRVYYDDSKDVGIKPSDYNQKCVKLVVVNKTDFYKFDKLVDGFYNNNLIELKIIEDLSEFEFDSLEDEQVNIEDTMTLLSEYVDSIETEGTDKERLKTVLKTLYIEAQNVQV